MTIYKFRVMYEEDDSIFRDIEIKPSQTISDFESVIVSSYNLPVNSNGQFYKSNDSWHRVKQLMVAPLPEQKKGKTKAKAHALPILVAFIDDPHQKFIYEYKGSQEFVFLIELMTLTGNEKPTVIYPVCVRQQGPSPFKKEELVAHYSKVADDGDQEEHRVDDEEDDLESMSKEGEEEDLVEEEAVAEPEDDVAEDVAEEAEDEIPEEAELEEFGEEEFGEDFPGGADED